MEQLALAWGPVRKTFTVAEINARIRGLLGDEFDDVWVAGEISGSKTAASGHCYFTSRIVTPNCVACASANRFAI